MKKRTIYMNNDYLHAKGHENCKLKLEDPAQRIIFGSSTQMHY